MYYIYILYSGSSDKYYVGYTDDPARRVIEHNTKPFNTYTSKHRPWELVASFWAGATRGEAIRVERYIKRQKSRAFLQKLIAYQDDPEQIAQLVRVPTCRD